MKKISALISLVLLVTICHAQRLERFADSNNSGRQTGYQHIKNYFDFIDSLQVPDAILEEGSFYYIYFSLADTLPNLGLRIVNPVPVYAMPDKGDEVTTNYYANEKNVTAVFNSWMALEKDTAMNENGLRTYMRIAANDDGKEVPEYTNSIIRMHSKKNEFITPGNYRIAISSSKKEKITGRFLLQLGSDGNIKQVKLSSQPL
ncbi:MAG: LipL32 family surface lipoprotein [Bacteroidota bacterium]